MYESPCNIPPGIYELHIHPRDLYTSPGSVNTDSWALPQRFQFSISGAEFKIVHFQEVLRDGNALSIGHTLGNMDKVTLLL